MKVLAVVFGVLTLLLIVCVVCCVVASDFDDEMDEYEYKMMHGFPKEDNKIGEENKNG